MNTGMNWKSTTGRSGSVSTVGYILIGAHAVAALFHHFVTPTTFLIACYRVSVRVRRALNWSTS